MEVAYWWVSLARQGKDPLLRQIPNDLHGGQRLIVEPSGDRRPVVATSGLVWMYMALDLAFGVPQQEVSEERIDAMVLGHICVLIVQVDLAKSRRGVVMLLCVAPMLGDQSSVPFRTPGLAIPGGSACDGCLPFTKDTRPTRQDCGAQASEKTYPHRGPAVVNGELMFRCGATTDTDMELGR